ncbi:SURF1 family protein [Nocardioides sp.]|uniref:SURF1 family cytochrome oxidase biogenesis protein n=1 Tax=Nocardioides sp. TaxID=35761 RepID=UPI002735416D|nr:SURF1 family protein [Nocardioides sp.]MDP3890172.1 SURF1 family protein [Nocardioides sp.]
MHSIRFLASRRWALLALTVVVLAWVAWALGQWQFHRLEDRQDRNVIVERNTSAAPVPVEDVMAVGRPVSREDEWRQVTATGTYATDQTVVVRYRTRQGQSGVDLVVPLMTDDGPALLVDRGWMMADNRGRLEDVPEPARTPVTVTGWVRADATGDSTLVTERSTRAISSVAIGEALDLEVYGGFVDLVSEAPEVGAELAPAEPPELNDGPHFFYGLQWWFFGALALFGFGYLAYDEWRKAREGAPAA